MVFDVMYPKSAVRGLTPGFPRFGWFRQLKASKRNSELSHSKMRNLLRSDASRFQFDGALMMPSPAFPKVPAVGTAKAFGLNHSWPTPFGPETSRLPTRFQGAPPVPMPATSIESVTDSAAPVR